MAFAVNQLPPAFRSLNTYRSLAY